MGLKDLLAFQDLKETKAQLVCEENQGLLGHQGTWALKDSKACPVSMACLAPKATWVLQAPRDSQGPRVNEVYQD